MSLTQIDAGTTYLRFERRLTATAASAEIALKPAQPCPVCGKHSALVRGLDRFIHLDGSDNRACWTVILRGDAS